MSVPTGEDGGGQTCPEAEGNPTATPDAQLNDPQSIMDHTELIMVTPEKYKYVNTRFAKVKAKMYDYKCDVKLNVGKETFRAHRDVLSEASDYFSAMFGHNMREKDQEAIELLEISSAGFTAMLEYFYHGHITIVHSNIENIMEASRFFMIEWLLKVCCDFLTRNLSLDYYDNVLSLVDTFVLDDLRCVVISFIGNNFTTLEEQQKLVELSYDLFDMLLSEDYYIEATELFILKAVLCWIRHAPDEREKYMADMLVLIRFPLFEPEELEQLQTDVTAIPAVAELVLDAKKYHANPQLQCLLMSQGMQSRGSKDVVMAMAAIEDINLIQYKHPSLPGFFTEEAGSDFLQSVFEFAEVAIIGNFMFVVGGYERHNWCSSAACYLYNPRTRAWGQLASLNQPRVSFALCASDTDIYAIAGIEHIVEEVHDTENILPSAEQYSPEVGVWKFIPDLPCGCFSIAAAFCRGTLFVSGGINDDPEDNVPVNYNRSWVPGQEQWVNMTPMLTERQGHSMTALHDKLYVLGGYHSGEDTMSFSHCFKAEVYDVELNQWSRLRDLHPKVEHVHASTAVVGDKIYVLGGSSSVRFLGAYNTETNAVENIEYVGDNVLKVTTVRLAFPMSLE